MFKKSIATAAVAIGVAALGIPTMSSASAYGSDCSYVTTVNPTFSELVDGNTHTTQVFTMCHKYTSNAIVKVDLTSLNAPTNGSDLELDLVAPDGTVYDLNTVYDASSNSVVGWGAINENNTMGTWNVVVDDTVFNGFPIQTAAEISRAHVTLL